MKRLGLLSGGAAALASTLAACGIPGTKSSAGGGTLQGAFEAIDEFWAKQKKTGHLDFENWPLYIDVGKNDSDHPSLDLFTKETGIKVTYTEGIQQVDTYFGKIQPTLASGEGIGEDIIVITNGLYLDKLIESDFLIPLDQARMVNFYKYGSSIAINPSFDRGNNYTMPWQSGITGIGYDPDKVGKKITSWNDLQPSEYGFFSNVNPAVDHPRWSQKTERRIAGTQSKLFADRIPTRPFNGYGDQVAGLYAGMDLRRWF